MRLIKQGTAIGRVRAAGRERTDPWIARKRFEGALRGTSLQPVLPPDAILIVRRFRDPLPRTLSLSAGETHPPAAWQHAVSRELARIASRAACPALGVVPAGAEAVLFTDRAELLACLARDWHGGDVTDHWWWKSLGIDASDIRSEVLKLWLETPPYIPTALEILAQSRTAVAFAGMLSQAEARILLRAVVAAFGANEVADVLRDALGPNEETTASQPMRSAARREFDASLQSDQPARAFPWMPWVPESAEATLDFEQQCLLGVGLMLQRAAPVLRSTQFLEQVRHWVGGRAGMKAAAQPAHNSLHRADNTLVTRPVVLQFQTSSTSDSHSIPPAPECMDTSVAVTQSQAAAITEPRPTDLPRVDPPSSRDVASVDLPYHPTMPASTREALHAAFETRGPMSAEFHSAGQLAETNLGGCFYLINFGILLNFYGDFTMPLRPGIELPIWNWAAFVTRLLLNETDRADALWGLLGRLAGRQGLTDVDLDTEAPPAWLIALMPYLRWRLERSLGIAEDADVAGLLIRRHAMVRTTHTHLDVHFALDELPFAIRLSGLDRDPGWVPAAGRFIRFHYE